MKVFLLFFLTTMSLGIEAQTSGHIMYEEKIDIHRRMTGDRAQFKEMVPQFRTVQMELIFKEGESVYIRSKEANNALPPEAGQGRGRGFRMRMMGGGADGVVYLNLNEYKRIEQRGFMDKKFLIKGEPESFAWKLTGETMQVGAYMCQKAIFQDSTTNMIAWFTPQIPVALGPGRYGQLPGLILHVDINEGERTLTATEIDLETADFSKIEMPKKGKEVTQEEFRTIMREKMKEMRSQGRGPGARVIRGNN